jgi:hypothetical protein
VLSVNLRAAGAVGLATAVGVACALRDPRVSGSTLACGPSALCPSESVCFLSECRSSSSQLSIVQAEVRAPASEQLGAVQRADLDLRVSPIVDFDLHPLLSAAGTVVRRLADGGTDFVTDAGVVLTESSPPIPDRVPNVATQTDTGGAFSLSFAQATWNVVVVPPAPEPPVRVAAPTSPLSSSTTGLQVVIPASSDLTMVTATLLAGGTALSGARVTATDASGSRLSVSATTDTQGAFALALPPGPPEYFLQIGPDPTASSGTPAVPAFPPRGPFFTATPGLSCPAAPSSNCIDVGALPDPANLTGTVLDARHQPIAGAAVLALSLDPTGWILSRQTTTDATGAYTLSVRTGFYTVEAVPPADPTLPAVSGEVQWPVPSGGALTLVCPDKSQASGIITRADRQRVGSGHQVTATRFPDHLLTGRAATTTPTDTSGSFTIIGDPGQYRLEVVPPVASGLPRTIVAVELPATSPATLPTVQLPAPLAVVGTVRKNNGTEVVVGAAVDFFALDASGARSTLIGSGLTDSQGHYRAVLPDVSSPVGQ